MTPTYDVWLEWVITPSCNLSCRYCWNLLGKKRSLMDIFSRKSSGPEKPIDCEALVRTLNKTGKVFRIGFSGGEPFLIPNMVEACKAITKDHFVSFSTNLTSPTIKRFAEEVDPSRVVVIMGSLHIKELERNGMTDRYIENFLYMKERGFNIRAIEVAFPPLSGEAEKYRKFFKGLGIELDFGMFCGEYRGVTYPESYTEQELKSFGIDRNKDMTKVHLKGKPCNAGYNVLVSRSGDGRITPCHRLDEDMGNLYKEIRFRRTTIICPNDYCTCPAPVFEPRLFETACRESGIGPVSLMHTKKDDI